MYGKGLTSSDGFSQRGSLDFFTKGILTIIQNWNTQTPEGIAKALGCSPKTDSKTTPTQVIEHEEIELVPTESLLTTG